MINQVITITELASLTGKSRPTLYKYITNYELGEKGDIPYSIIKLLDIINKPNVSKKEIINYCKSTFLQVNDDMEIQEIINLITENRDKINLKQLKKAIKEGIKNG